LNPSDQKALQLLLSSLLLFSDFALCVAKSVRFSAVRMPPAGCIRGEQPMAKNIQGTFSDFMYFRAFFTLS
jgi:hypothetical protein